jgi:hypothetical protein
MIWPQLGFAIRRSAHQGRESQRSVYSPQPLRLCRLAAFFPARSDFWGMSSVDVLKPFIRPRRFENFRATRQLQTIVAPPVSRQATAHAMRELSHSAGPTKHAMARTRTLGPTCSRSAPVR